MVGWQIEPRGVIRGDLAIIPADVSQRCNSAEFAILAVEPALLKQVGQDLVADRIELIPRFMSEQDALLQAIFLHRTEMN